MTEAEKPQGDVSVIAKFFFTNGEKASEKLAEIKALTSDDKAQLGEGIRNGSLTY